MRFQEEVSRAKWLTLFVLILLSFLSVGVLVRMAPAIEKTFFDNDYSLEACEDMLAALIRHEQVDETQAAEQAFYHALARAKNNITETKESDAVLKIEQEARRAFAGLPRSRELTAEAIMNLTRINRRAMRSVHVRTQRLGSAGAWAITVTSFCAFIGALILFRRLRDHVVIPFSRLVRVLENAHDRTTAHRLHIDDVSPEMTAFAARVNRLLSEGLGQPKDAAVASEHMLRLALKEIADQNPKPILILGPNDKVIFANKEALRRTTEHVDSSIHNLQDLRRNEQTWSRLQLTENAWLLFG